MGKTRAEHRSFPPCLKAAWPHQDLWHLAPCRHPRVWQNFIRHGFRRNCLLAALACSRFSLPIDYKARTPRPTVTRTSGKLVILGITDNAIEYLRLRAASDNKGSRSLGRPGPPRAIETVLTTSRILPHQLRSPSVVFSPIVP
jgi:hypothetical protein